MNDYGLAQIPWTAFRPRRKSLAAGAVLTGVGAMTVAAGVGVLIYELARTGRHWTDHWEVPPSELAQRTFSQARTAARAGRDAWVQQQNNGHVS